MMKNYPTDHNTLKVRRNMNIFIEHDRLRESLIQWLSDISINLDIDKAVGDHHASRRPIPCGLTIHTGIGCPYQCVYCYIYSMGFPRKIVKYPLSPEELGYSILSNKNFIPGRYGTLLALGSVTEPLHIATRDYTLNLLSILYRFGNPIQLSTKESLEYLDAARFKPFRNRLNVLITVTTIDKARLIEPYAPDPYKRLEFGGFLIDLGISTTLFIRPAIPGVTDREIENILKYSEKYGFKEVIFGTLRVNNDILDRFRSISEPVYREVASRSPELEGNKQKPIYMRDIKERLVKKAREMGFKVLPTACSASILASGQACNMCKYGPCGDINDLPKIDGEDVKEFLELKNVRAKDIEVRGWYIKVSSGKPLRRDLAEFIKTVSRRRLISIKA